MSDEATDATPTDRDRAAVQEGESPANGRAALIEALGVRHNARRGFAFGIGFTVLVFFFFVVAPGTTRSPLYYLALAFVLAMGIGGLVTAALTVARAWRLVRDL